MYATYSMAKHFAEAGRMLLLRYLAPGQAGIGRSVAVEPSRRRGSGTPSG